jgi:hypothetical protein
MNSNYNQRDWAWKPTSDVIAALQRGDNALRNFYLTVDREYLDSLHIGQTLDWEAKLESYSKVMR